ncbi:hypothetical protein IPA_09135 [Ignicoccus pacificus DSM 13166]|uniref:Uncharacterized protein n=1 Tax=Ignicoccus pacificus DSM 13166 TaxID=940294 RepID=A0A977PM14_9CREN|nr:hypothetical protein IPA_09135 [Ignicoccus pacificus DSM 13166]
MVVKCPYGEKKGFAVYCKILRKKVSPLKYPCMGNYEHCPHYREAQELSARTVKHEPEAVEVVIASKVEKKEEKSAPPPPTSPTSFKPPEQASNCYECVYYSSLTGYCMRLRVKVEDPYSPPCKK